MVTGSPACTCCAQRSLQDWLATMSHDARTPLSSIKVSCALLTSCELCPVARELLASVNAGARVMLLIVNHGAHTTVQASLPRELPPY